MEIFTIDDLKRETYFKVINGDIIIRGEHIKQLEGVEKINGSLCISDSSIESLGELKEIIGDFWISYFSVYSQLTSLNSLEKIGGNVSLRYSNILDFGKLKYVGGKLSIRDTKINSLGNLKYLGGDLYLPKKLQNKIDLNNVRIIGKVKYWHDAKNKIKIIENPKLPLEKSGIPVPYWQHQYIFSTKDLKFANSEQVKFYRYFKDCFFKNNFIDIAGNDNYAFVLYYDLLEDFDKHNDIEKLQEQFTKIEKYYPKTGFYTLLSLIDKFNLRGDFKNAWLFTCKLEYISVQTIWEFQKKLKTPLLNGELMVKLGGYSHLTFFGQKNIEKIKPFTLKYLQTYESENNSSFFNLFFDENNLFRAIDNDQYSAEYYQKFYLSDAEFHHYKLIDDSQIKNHNPKFIRHIVEKAVINQCRLILKKSEDLYRESIGMPKVGEGWISETELFYKLTDTFTEFEVVQHGKPSWLGKQHIDIYFPALNIGIEYQGAQHYEPIDFFGGKESFEKTKERDELKKKKCAENNCILIYVEENYDFASVLDEIKKYINISKINVS